jgi:hypothetical protein
MKTFVGGNKRQYQYDAPVTSPGDWPQRPIAGEAQAKAIADAVKAPAPAPATRKPSAGSRKRAGR